MTTTARDITATLREAFQRELHSRRPMPIVIHPRDQAWWDEHMPSVPVVQSVVIPPAPKGTP